MFTFYSDKRDREETRAVSSSRRNKQSLFFPLGRRVAGWCSKDRRLMGRAVMWNFLVV